MECKCRGFINNERMPGKYTGFGEDISPELTLESLPENTVSLAIIMDDLDVPFLPVFTHWIIWNMPPVTTIPEGIPKGKEISHPFKAVQGNAWGKHVYRGPKQPLLFRTAHRYRFTVYAIDTVLDLSPEENRAGLIKAMTGHVIEKAEITCIYDPRTD